MKTLRTLIIDDERLAREELKSLLKQYDEIDIIGEAKNGEEAILMIKDLKPELIFLGPDENSADLMDPACLFMKKNDFPK